ncbi:MAG: zinc metalloprotease HtpX [Chloroflexi bacterium]|nr:zinc metalloprotease HtpX [Chloroflexota bacterium]
MLRAPSDFGHDNQLRVRMWFTMALLGLVYAVFLFVLFRLGVGVGIMLALAGGLALFQLLASDRMVLATMRAKVVTPQEQPELHRMVERLSLAAGIPKPKVAVSDMQVPNAFATGRSQKTAAVAVTSGLMALLSERELEGVLAHEISHIRTRDVVVMTYASFFLVVASTLMNFLFFSAIFGGMGRGRHGGGNVFMIAYVVTIVVWLISQMLVAALSRYREFGADRGAAVLTRRPGDLASALQRIQATITGLPQNDLRRAESLNAFFIMPAVGDGFAKLFATHPPMNRRVELLREMERGIMMLA